MSSVWALLPMLTFAHVADRVVGQPNIAPSALIRADVDPAMWPIVERINRSGWIWTTESCQGHDDRGPLLGVVTNDPGRFFFALSDAHRDAFPDGVEGRQDPKGVRVAVQFWMWPRVALGRYQYRLTVDRTQQQKGLQLFTALAARVTP